MPAIFNTDNPAHIAELRSLTGVSGYRGVMPRQKLYGDIPGVEAIEDALDAMVPVSDLREALEAADNSQSLPIYHMRRWAPVGFRWDQDGLGYCWTWSGVACLLSAEAKENKPFVPLAPVSMGYLVGWRNRGNFLEDFVRGAQEDGVCEARDGDMNSHNINASYWAQFKDTRKLHRLGRAIDTDPRNMVQHYVTGLAAGWFPYLAYDWWGHAVPGVSGRMGPSGLEVTIRNSHNEADVITLTGSKAVPSECIFFVGTK